MGQQAIEAEAAMQLQEQRWRDAALAAWKARRDYEALAADEDADERALNLLWLKLWRADRACDSLLASAEEH